MSKDIKNFLRPVVYTMCESIVACLIASHSIYEVDWKNLFGAVAISTLLSVFLNIQKLTSEPSIQIEANKDDLDGDQMEQIISALVPVLTLFCTPICTGVMAIILYKLQRMDSKRDSAREESKEREKQKKEEERRREKEKNQKDKEEWEEMINKLPHTRDFSRE